MMKHGVGSDPEAATAAVVASMQRRIDRLIESGVYGLLPLPRGEAVVRTRALLEALPAEFAKEPGSLPRLGVYSTEEGYLSLEWADGEQVYWVEVTGQGYTLFWSPMGVAPVLTETAETGEVFEFLRRVTRAIRATSA